MNQKHVARSLLEEYKFKSIKNHHAIKSKARGDAHSKAQALSDTHSWGISDFKDLSDFRKVQDLSKESSDLLYDQALNMFTYGSLPGNEKALTLASQIFETYLERNPLSLKALQMASQTLFLIGASKNQPTYYIQAEERLKKALEISQDLQAQEKVLLHWDYALIWNKIASFSLEASDVNKALDAFSSASTKGTELPQEFWSSYGSTALEMAKLVPNVEFCQLSIRCFKLALSKNMFSSHDLWQLAKATSKLYSITQDPKVFAQAQEYFNIAEPLNCFNESFCASFATFLSGAEATLSNLRIFELCVEKCKKFYNLHPETPLFLGLEGVALSIIGTITDNLEPIHKACKKALEALDQSLEMDPDIWHCSGKILLSQAAYHADLDYYYQAIEKFQLALSADSSRHKDWYYLGLCYSQIGENESDIEAFEKAERFYRKAVNLFWDPSYLFAHAASLCKLGELKLHKPSVEKSLSQIEKILQVQKDSVSFKPQWLFQYAVCLDIMGDFCEDETYYVKAFEILSQISRLHTSFPRLDYQLAIVSSHLAETGEEKENLARSLHHFRKAHSLDEDNDQLLLEWGITLLNAAEHSFYDDEMSALYAQAEGLFLQSISFGNEHAYYHIGCLYSILGKYEKSMHFLKKSKKAGLLPSVEEMLEDDWLEGVRSSSLFIDFLSSLD